MVWPGAAHAADRGLSRPTSVFRTTIGVCKILYRAVEIWQYKGQNLFWSKNSDFKRLQFILNTAIRLVAGSSRRDHVTSLLRDRHWLPVKQRVEYKLCTIVHRCLYGDASSYLVDLIKPSAAALQVPELVWDLLSRWPSQCHARCHHLETALLRPLVRVRGTTYRHTSVWCSPPTLLDVILKHFFISPGLFIMTLLGALVVLLHLRRRNLDFLGR